MTDWADLGKKLAAYAPAVGAAVGGPGGAVVGALVAARLGVHATPQDIDKALRDDPDAPQTVAELTSDPAMLSAMVELAKTQSADTADARAQHKGHWMPATLTLLLAVMLIGAGYALFAFEVPAANRDMANIAFGALLGAFSTGVSYWLGSSRGSAEARQDLINRK